MLSTNDLAGFPFAHSARNDRPSALARPPIFDTNRATNRSSIPLGNRRSTKRRAGILAPGRLNALPLLVVGEDIRSGRLPAPKNAGDAPPEAARSIRPELLSGGSSFTRVRRPRPFARRRVLDGLIERHIQYKAMNSMPMTACTTD